MSATHTAPAVPGDVVEESGRRVGDHSRIGEILEVLGPPEHPHYLVRWEDGHESTFYPGSDAVVQPGRHSRASAKA